MRTRILALFTIGCTLSAGHAAGAAPPVVVTAGTILANAKAQIILISSDLAAMTAADAETKIRRAGEHLKGLASLLDAYARSPADPTTAPTAAEWKGYHKRMGEALTTMETLQKTTTELQAETTKLIGECTAAESVLAARVKAAIAANDPSAISELSAMAEKVEALVDPKLDRMLAKLKRSEEMRAVIERFDASGLWDAVENNLESAARALVEANTRARKAVFASCEQLALGDAHTRILEAVKTLKRLQADTFNDIPKLRAGHQQFLGAIKALREWHEHEVEKVRLALCDLNDPRGQTALGSSVLGTLLDRITAEMVRRKDEITRAADSLDVGVTGHVGKGTLTEGDRKLLKQIAADIKRIKEQVDNAVTNSSWAKGSNNPHIRLRLDVGKQEHAKYQSSSSNCTASEIVLLNSKRIDCVKVNGNVCTIVEVKPDTPSAVRDGKGQVKGYWEEIARMWDHGRGKSKFDKNGLQVFLRCQKGDELLLAQPQVVEYKFCPAPGSLGGDFLLPNDVDMSKSNLWDKLMPVP